MFRQGLEASVWMFLFLVVLLKGSLLLAEVPIVIETEFGVIEAVLDDQKAPVTVAGFLKYVDANHYTGGRFFRTVRTSPDNQPKVSVKIDVVQAGVNPDLEKNSFPPFKLERTNDTGLKHIDG